MKIPKIHPWLWDKTFYWDIVIGNINPDYKIKQASQTRDRFIFINLFGPNVVKLFLALGWREPSTDRKKRGYIWTIAGYKKECEL